MTDLSLLDYLVIHCRVDYISDLSLTPICKEVLRQIDEKKFPLPEEWNEAVRYLTKNNDISFQTVTSAKEYLISFKK